jgi:hypothetical protein
MYNEWEGFGKLDWTHCPRPDMDGPTGLPSCCSSITNRDASEPNCTRRWSINRVITKRRTGGTVLQWRSISIHPIIISINSNNNNDKKGDVQVAVAVEGLDPPQELVVVPHVHQHLFLCCLLNVVPVVRRDDEKTIFLFWGGDLDEKERWRGVMMTYMWSKSRRGGSSPCGTHKNRVRTARH